MAKTLLQFDPTHFVPDASNPPGVDQVQDRVFLAYDDTTVETARTKAIEWPQGYAAGALKAKLYYFMASATSGLVDFEVSIEAVTDADPLVLDAADSFDTANAAQATVPGTAGHLDMLDITLGNIDSVAIGDMVRFKLERDADDGTDDTASGDARVIALIIEEA